MGVALGAGVMDPYRSVVRSTESTLAVNSSREWIIILFYSGMLDRCIDYRLRPYFFQILKEGETKLVIIFINSLF